MPSTPTPLAPGARVVIRDEEWIVRAANKANPGGHALRVVGASELVRGKEAIFLTDLDTITELAPETTELVTDDSPQYRRTRLYLEALLRCTPPPAGDSRIYLGHEAAIDAAPYQLVPAAKALRQPRPRILIADGVGLGKTIETGVLLTELIERGRGDRILVVALKSILAQFQQELWARFTIPLVRLDSVGIQRVMARIPSSMNPFHYHDRVIISIDTLKKDAKYRRYLEQCHWDVIVVDECQNVAVRGRSTSRSEMSQRARLAKLLASTCDALIMTSATPHDGRPDSFASVIQLLEPTAIADPTNYTNADIGDLYVRRFKKDIAHEVAEEFQERSVQKEHVTASPAEEAVLAMLHDLEFRTVAAQRNSRGILFRTLLLKAFLSSPAACLATIDERLKTLDTLRKGGKLPAGALDHDRTVLLELQAAAERVTPEHFAKYQRFLGLAKQLGLGAKRNDSRVVLFSERIDTLKFLQQQLTRDLGLADDQTALFYGSLDDQAQRRIVQDFGTGNHPVRLLLASDAAAEGLNLHYYCHRLFHFDLPWSLITLEQRNGRIDRYGQKHRPILTYLLTRPSSADLQGDLRILDVLIDKEQQAHINLGDVAWLMDLHDASSEEERVASAIEKGEDPDVVMPDRDRPNDFLSILMGQQQQQDLAAETTRDPSLYADDVAYCRDAFALVLEQQPELVEYHEHLQGFTLLAPDDLQHRLAYLPPELQRNEQDGRTVLKLTTDRQRVMEALDASRQKEGQWPEWQLLWEQHPVCEWLDETLVAAFHRHAAPVLFLGRGLHPDESVVLMQGQLTNERGQPVIVSWFGVSFRGAKVAQVRSLADLLRDTGLDQPQPNPGSTADEKTMQTLQGLLPAAVQKGREHMLELRTERMAELSQGLRQNVQSVAAWARQRLQQIQGERDKATAGGHTLAAPRRKQLEQEEEQIAREQSSRTAWLQEGMRTNPTPYLRVAAVLVPAKAVRAP